MKYTQESIIAALLLVFLFVFTDTHSQQKRDSKKDMPLFESDEILNLRIEADFKKVFKNNDDSTYFPARATFENNNGENVSMDIKVRTRGNFRRKRSNCSFTPLQVKFPKKKTKNTIYEGQRAIKLVTHCKKSDSYEQNTMAEYLTYKILNILTDSSLRVRPVIINYVFNGKKVDSVEKFAFFIERPKHMASRLGGRLLNAKYVHPDSTAFNHMTLIDLFQFMIGNTDYSVYNMHNIKLVAIDPFDPPVTIPYDFDWSGMISAPYARPNPMFPIDDVETRLYRGFKRNYQEIKPTVDLFNHRRSEIMKMIETFPHLNKKERNRVITYIDGFYQVINDASKLQSEIIEAGRINN